MVSRFSWEELNARPQRREDAKNFVQRLCVQKNRASCGVPIKSNLQELGYGE